MAFPRLRSADTVSARPPRTRLISEKDAPVASPVHALQDCLHQLVLPVRDEGPAFDGRAAAIRIGLYVVGPLAFWAAIIRMIMLA